MLRIILVSIVLTVASLQVVHSQANIGFVTGGDLYQRYVNPEDGTGFDRSAGSAILNSTLGLKTWLGSKKVALSIESYVNLGVLGLNVEEYYGLGTMHIPVMAKINFGGLTGLGDLKRFGYYIGGGWQINKTELFGLNDKAQDRGIQRPYYNTYVVEIGTGRGNKSKMTEFFVRFGLNPEMPSNSLSIGLNTSYSFPFMKMLSFNVTPEKDDSDIIKM